MCKKVNSHDREFLPNTQCKRTCSTVTGVRTPALSYIAVIPSFLASTPVLCDSGVHVDVDASGECTSEDAASLLLSAAAVLVEIAEAANARRDCGCCCCCIHDKLLQHCPIRLLAASMIAVILLDVCAISRHELKHSWSSCSFLELSPFLTSMH